MYKFSFLLSEEEYKKLTESASQNERSISAQVRHFIRCGLNKTQIDGALKSNKKLTSDGQLLLDTHLEKILGPQFSQNVKQMELACLFEVLSLVRYLVAQISPDKSSENWRYLREAKKRANQKSIKIISGTDKSEIIEEMEEVFES